MKPDPSEIVEQIAAFDPATSQIPAMGLIVLGLACGVILWLFGSKVLGPVVFVLGGAIGAAVGMIAPQHLAIEQIAGYPASLIGLGIGAVVGGLLSAALYHTAITIGSGLTFAVAGLITGLATIAPVVVDAQQDAAEAIVQAETDDARESQPENLPGEEVVVTEEAQGEDGATSDLVNAAERATAFVQASLGAVEQQWTTLNQDQRLRVAGITLGGLVLGLIVGLIAHDRASSVVTASIGSGVWLYCFAWLGTQTALPWTTFTAGFGPREWVMAWGAAAVVGVIFQGLIIGSRSRTRPVVVAAEKAA